MTEFDDGLLASNRALPVFFPRKPISGLTSMLI